MMKIVEDSAEIDDDYDWGTRCMDEIRTESCNLERIVDMDGVKPFSKPHFSLIKSMSYPKTYSRMQNLITKDMIVTIVL